MNKKTLFAVITAAFVALPAAAATEGKDYEVISVEVAPVHQDKIEVTEFFAYWCPHCADLDPVLLRHAKQFPRDTVLRTEHVIWDEARDYPLARLAVAVNQSGEKYRANPAIFAALVQQRINLGNEEVLRQWLPQQTGFNAAKVQAALFKIIALPQISTSSHPNCAWASAQDGARAYRVLGGLWQSARPPFSCRPRSRCQKSRGICRRQSAWACLRCRVCGSMRPSAWPVWHY